ncbi:hypothetical protein OAT16_11225 [Prolixibacteraceae bacterium]|nr:hypothetical protein [Prolixibacteraceae bacterium]
MRKKYIIEQLKISFERMLFKFRYADSNPYIYCLLTKVIDNGHRYYFYNEIEAMVDEIKQSKRGKKRGLFEIPDEKELCCIYRLVNEIQPQCIYFCGHDLELYKSILGAVDSNIQLKSYDEYLSKTVNSDRIDLVFCNVSTCDKILGLFENIHIGDVVITHGLRSIDESQLSWSSLLIDTVISSSIESRAFGVGFTDPKLPKQNYYINY